MAERVVSFELIGGGLMGREFASACARWVHLEPLGVRPQIVAVADTNPDVLSWYQQLDPPSGPADHGATFPLPIETKRIAPGETNTWTIEIDGTEASVAYTTKFPKTLRTMEYRPGGLQAWQSLDLGSVSAYPHITGGIVEFGFSDAILQMWAAYLDELAHGREEMRQPFYCATPEEAAATHRLFTAALASHREHAVVPV